jgi:hypothetical protein|tara:strand:- start:747 stop:917 length:171 start_codon:yes stop_codon:yes gene_type:complete
MGTELYLIHLGFISACVFFSWKLGERSGREAMLDDLLATKALSLVALEKQFDNETE